MWRFLRRTGQLFQRALRLRCPNCGGGPIFDRWLRMRTHCPRCGLPMERGEQGYQVGSYMLAIIAAELVFAAIFLGILLLTWPHPPWDLPRSSPPTGLTPSPSRAGPLAGLV